MKKRVVICTPYILDPRYQRGGIQTWGESIISYVRANYSYDVTLLPVSLDRLRRSSSKNIVIRSFYGIIELFSPIKKVRSIVKKGECDVLHLCSSGSMGLLRDWVVSVISASYHVKMILHLHFGRIPTIANNNTFEWRLLCKLVKRVDKVIVMDCQSEATLAAFGFNNVECLPNPISQDVLDKVESQRGIIEQKPNRVLFVGHLYREKGIFELVRACASIPGIELVFVGSYTEDIKQEIEAISSLSDTERPVLLGEMAHELVIQQMMQSRVFALPSYTEGFPYVILESMACGCSIVSTYVGAIPDMLNIGKDRECGICVEPKNVKALRNALIYALNPQVAVINSNNAIIRVRDMYTIEIVAKKLCNIWCNV